MNNCTKFVIDALRAGGIEVDDFIRPDSFFDYLRDKYGAKN